MSHRPYEGIFESNADLTVSYIISKAFVNECRAAKLLGRKTTDRGAMFPDELVDCMKRGEVMIFAGAGLSMNAGLPGWSELAQPFAHRVGYRWPAPEDLTTEHLLATFQYYDNQYSRNTLLRALQERLASPGRSPALAHYLITLLPVQSVFTTNYDNLIERAYADVLYPARVVVNVADLAYVSPSSPQIFKLCGDLTRPESIVITRSDFNIYAETHQRLIEHLRSTMETRTALFLGYSLRDPFLNHIWDVIRLAQGQHQRMAYAILFHAAALEVDDLQRRGIFPVTPQPGTSVQIALNSLLIDTLKLLETSVPANRLENVMAHIPPAMAPQLEEYYHWYTRGQQ
jgi:hypothetical protein